MDAQDVFGKVCDDHDDCAKTSFKYFVQKFAENMTCLTS